MDDDIHGPEGPDGLGEQPFGVGSLRDIRLHGQASSATRRHIAGQLLCLGRITGVATSEKPSRPRRCATAPPIPPDAPVTIAVLVPLAMLISVNCDQPPCAYL
jgi:hypothetical protein